MTKISKTTVCLACANGIAVILGLVITEKLLFDQPQIDFPETNKDTPELRAQATIENHSLLEVPLFQPSRKPIVVSSETIAPAAMPPPSPPPKLVGIIQIGKDRMVQLEAAANQTSGLIHEGESFGDWKIKNIEKKSASISLDDDQDLTIFIHPEMLEVTHLKID
ncbi:hypothetical protein [Methylomonas sp. UP202]|uniref:hypothetical protein n=1 Tax=Methylomonas sp. UP202 TaxID=3040943 RepID=UPI00247A1EB9|nr:hypothetical protein [Methylomonas sp. UP202]WGS88630.1 hypothetical protein QC632_25130 [Methylomonas sp. UP202]